MIQSKLPTPATGYSWMTLKDREAGIEVVPRRMYSGSPLPSSERGGSVRSLHRLGNSFSTCEERRDGMNGKADEQ